MKKNKLILFLFSFATFFSCKNVHALTLTDPDISFSSFLDLLSEVCSMFLKYFILFCNALLSNYFILCILGIVLFVASINLIFEIVSLFRVSPEYLQDSIEKRLEEKHDFEVKTYELARKELIMRQNYQYNLDKKVSDAARKELIMRQNYQYNLDKKVSDAARKELIMRQNYQYNLDKKVSDAARKELIMRQNYQYNLGKNVFDSARKELIMRQNKLDRFDYGSNSIVSLSSNYSLKDPFWLDNTIQKKSISEEDKRELDELLKPFE